MSDPDDTLPPDPLASTIPSPPPPGSAPRRIMGPAWHFTAAGDPVYTCDWDGFASEALDE